MLPENIIALSTAPKQEPHSSMAPYREMLRIIEEDLAYYSSHEGLTETRRLSGTLRNARLLAKATLYALESLEERIARLEGKR